MICRLTKMTTHFDCKDFLLKDKRKDRWGHRTDRHSEVIIDIREPCEKCWHWQFYYQSKFLWPLCSLLYMSSSHIYSVPPSIRLHDMKAIESSGITTLCNNNTVISVVMYKVYRPQDWQRFENKSLTWNCWAICLYKLVLKGG